MITQCLLTVIINQFTLLVSLVPNLVSLKLDCLSHLTVRFLDRLSPLSLLCHRQIICQIPQFMLDFPFPHSNLAYYCLKYLAILLLLGTETNLDWEWRAQYILRLERGHHQTLNLAVSPLG